MKVRDVFVCCVGGSSTGELWVSCTRMAGDQSRRGGITLVGSTTVFD